MEKKGRTVRWTGSVLLGVGVGIVIAGGDCVVLLGVVTAGMVLSVAGAWMEKG